MEGRALAPNGLPKPFTPKVRAVTIATPDMEARSRSYVTSLADSAATSLDDSFDSDDPGDGGSDYDSCE